MIFDRVKREYLGEAVAVVRWCVLDQDNGWKSRSPSLDGGVLFQREKSIFMRDLLFSGACPCERRVKRSSVEVRAFGGCLGAKRRRRTWHAAKSCGEGRAPVDPQVSEWGNPSRKGDPDLNP